MGGAKGGFAALVLCAVSVTRCASEGPPPPVDVDAGDVLPDTAAEATVEAELDRLEARGASRAAIVVIDPRDGRILAMGGRGPDGLAEAHRQVEVGSTLKPLTVAAALDAGLDPASRYDSHGVIEVEPGLRIYDVRNHRGMSVARVIAASSNVGTAQIVADVGDAPIAAIFERIDARVPEVRSWPMHGAGIGVTMSAVDLAAAYGALANGGLLIEPTVAGDGRRQRVVTEETATAVRNMLESAVGEEGTGRNARVEGHRVGGKTGTLGGGVVFAGIAPIDAPRFVVVIYAEMTGDRIWSGRIAAPSFARVAGRLLAN